MAEPRLHRLITDGRWSPVEVYAPWCLNCGSDARTKWDRLPTLDEMIAKVVGKLLLDSAEAICLGCEKILRIDSREAWHAREPERLERRLIELRAEASLAP